MKYDRVESIRAFVTIRFMGGILQPDQISQLLHIGPTISYVEGEGYLAGPEKKQQYRRTSLWMLDTEKEISSLYLTDHVIFAKRVLTGKHLHAKPHLHIDKLHDILKAQGAKLDVGLFWYGHMGSPSPKVDPELESIVSKIRGQIELDFHQDGDLDKDDELMIA